LAAEWGQNKTRRGADIRAANAEPIDIDAGGAHAWLAGATILDLGLEAALRGGGRASLCVHNVEDPAELAVLSALAHRHGARAAIRDNAAAQVDNRNGANGAVFRVKLPLA